MGLTVSAGTCHTGALNAANSRTSPALSQEGQGVLCLFSSQPAGRVQGLIHFCLPVFWHAVGPQKYLPSQTNHSIKMPSFANTVVVAGISLSWADLKWH